MRSQATVSERTMSTVKEDVHSNGDGVTGASAHVARFSLPMIHFDPVNRLLAILSLSECHVALWT